MTSRASLVLLGILVVAALLRVYGVAFGLPSMLDPDEPIFGLSALRLLRDQTLNPGWFGHPGTTTIYTLAVIDVLVYLVGHLTGQFASPKALAAAAYLDPTVLILPARLFIVACGVACVFLTAVIGRKLFSRQVGLIAAVFLATSPLHIRYSQVIRTDVHGTVFALLVVMLAVNYANSGRTRQLVFAGVALGLATATKWPLLIFGLAPLFACAYRASTGEAIRTQLARLGVLCATTVIALVAASPYLLLDFDLAVRDVLGEKQVRHLGATGQGVLYNFAWYTSVPLQRAFGWIAIAAAGIGLALGAVRNPVFRYTVVPVFAVFFLMISVQSMIWDRWILPLLPFLCVFIAITICAASDKLAVYLGGRQRLAAALLTAVFVIPMSVEAVRDAQARMNDTRVRASHWARSHVPAGSTVLIEYFAWDLVRKPWTLVFPAGSVGCANVKEGLTTQIDYKKTVKLRAGRYLVNIGSMDHTQIESCYADYAIIVDYDRYLAEAPFYRAELAVYAELVSGGRELAVFRPVAGVSSGPVARIYQLRRSLTRAAPSLSDRRDSAGR